MTRKGQEKATQWTLSNILTIIALFLQVLQTLISLISFFEDKEISWEFFCMIIPVNIIIPAIIILSSAIFCIYKIITVFYALFKEYKTYRSENLELINSVIKYGSTWQKPYSYYKTEIKEKFVANCLAICVKSCGLLFIFTVVIILTCVCNPQNASAYWNNVKSFMGFTQEEEKASGVENIIDNERETGDIKETEKEVRNTKWRFILSEPTYSFDLETQMERLVFFASDQSFTERAVRGTVEQWKGEREGVDYKIIEDEEGNSFFTYIDIENTFKKEVEYASKYIYYEEWQQEAPHASELDICIAGREKLNKIEVEGKTGCYEIWWELANDYRYYAQEYETQTTNAKAILYYYTNSIYCCMEALKYSVTEEEYNAAYHFMLTRYHDICKDECIIPQEYKVAASNIYSILVETDALNGIFQ